MRARQPTLPGLWLISDARNDMGLERAIARLPRGSGVIFRHYHLPTDQRLGRFRAVRRAVRKRGMVVVLSGTPDEARRWHADGAYGSARALAAGACMLRLVTAHSLREIGKARRARASAIVLSPVFATRSHPGARALGPVRFRLLAARAGLPVIALGGMTGRRAGRLKWRRWAAIDGLSAN